MLGRFIRPFTTDKGDCNVANYKTVLCTITGALGSLVAVMFGGWGASLQALVGCMAIDYATGLIVAGIFHNSTKTDTGALESKAGFKGLCRKCMALVFVFIACRLDILLGITYLRDAVCIGYIVNELISLIENAGLMGAPVPQPIIDAIDILKKKKNKGE